MTIRNPKTEEGKTTVTKSECNEEVLTPSHLQIEERGLNSSAEDAAEEEHLALENCWGVWKCPKAAGIFSNQKANALTK